MAGSMVGTHGFSLKLNIPGLVFHHHSDWPSQALCISWPWPVAISGSLLCLPVVAPPLLQKCGAPLAQGVQCWEVRELWAESWLHSLPPSPSLPLYKGAVL